MFAYYWQKTFRGQSQSLLMSKNEKFLLLHMTQSLPTSHLQHICCFHRTLTPYGSLFLFTPTHGPTNQLTPTSSTWMWFVELEKQEWELQKRTNKKRVKRIKEVVYDGFCCRPSSAFSFWQLFSVRYTGMQKSSGQTPVGRVCEWVEEGGKGRGGQQQWCEVLLQRVVKLDHNMRVASRSEFTPHPAWVTRRRLGGEKAQETVRSAAVSQVHPWMCYSSERCLICRIKAA